MTRWAYISPKATYCIMAAMMVLIFVCYYATGNSESKPPTCLTAEHVGMRFLALNTDGKFSIYIQLSLQILQPPSSHEKCNEFYQV